jgi:hypothetical protein
MKAWNLSGLFCFYCRYNNYFYQAILFFSNQNCFANFLFPAGGSHPTVTSGQSAISISVISESDLYCNFTPEKDIFPFIINQTKDRPKLVQS